MKRLLYVGTLLVGTSLLVIGCGPAAETPPGTAVEDMSEFAEPPILDERESWPRVESAEDLAHLETLKTEWERAFAEGDAETLDFVFARDAVMTDLASLVGDANARPDRFFELYDADFTITNPDPIEYGNWGSYYADYELTLMDGSMVYIGSLDVLSLETWAW